MSSFHPIYIVSVVLVLSGVVIICLAMSLRQLRGKLRKQQKMLEQQAKEK